MYKVTNITRGMGKFPGWNLIFYLILSKYPGRFYINIQQTPHKLFLDSLMQWKWIFREFKFRDFPYWKNFLVPQNFLPLKYKSIIAPSTYWSPFVSCRYISQCSRTISAILSMFRIRWRVKFNQPSFSGDRYRKYKRSNLGKIIGTTIIVSTCYVVTCYCYSSSLIG